MVGTQVSNLPEHTFSINQWGTHFCVLTGKPKSLRYGNPVGSLLTYIYYFYIIFMGDGDERNMETYKRL